MFPITWGICAPQQCSEQDITTAVEELLGKVIWVYRTDLYSRILYIHVYI